jgi:hypothetical protein
LSSDCAEGCFAALSEVKGRSTQTQCAALFQNAVSFRGKLVGTAEVCAAQTAVMMTVAIEAFSA